MPPLREFAVMSSEELSPLCSLHSCHSGHLCSLDRPGTLPSASGHCYPLGQECSPSRFPCGSLPPSLPSGVYSNIIISVRPPLNIQFKPWSTPISTSHLAPPFFVFLVRTFHLSLLSSFPCLSWVERKLPGAAPCLSVCC